MRNKYNGFSLVEMIVVIVVLAIVIGISVLSMSKYVKKSKLVSDYNNIKSIEDTLKSGMENLDKDKALANNWIILCLDNTMTDNDVLSLMSSITKKTGGIVVSGIRKVASYNINIESVLKDIVISSCSDNDKLKLNQKGKYIYFYLEYDEYGVSVKADCWIGENNYKDVFSLCDNTSVTVKLLSGYINEDGKLSK